MCDTIVALGNSTGDGSVLFGKNTDREPNEAHNILHVPRQMHPEGSMVKCTYISIPQVKETYEVLLLKPFWIWGAEMGANEFGVVIGNEAVWTKEPLNDTGLLGMDLLRLALERSKTASEALKVITDLLERYSQGGLHGYKEKLNYHNSYIIADKKEAYVLETAGRYWIVEKVKDVRSISNTLTIRSEYDLIHPELIQHAIEKGYCKSEKDFDFARCFTPRFHIKNIGAKGKARHCYTMNLLNKNKGKLTPEIFMKILRDHNVDPIKEANWSPNKSSMKSICLHASSFLTPSQSVGSHVAHIKEDLQIHWVTGTSAPCISLYKPIFMPNIGTPDFGREAKEHYDPASLWWKHERLHRYILLDYQTRAPLIKRDRNRIEKKLLQEVYTFLKGKNLRNLSEKDKRKLKSISVKAFTRNLKKIDEWIELVKKKPITHKTTRRYRKFWEKFNKHDRIEL